MQQDNRNESADASPAAKAVNLQELGDAGASGPRLLDGALSLVAGVKVKVEVLVGGAELTVGELFDLKSGSVLALDQMKDAPLSVRLDGRTIALGTLVVVDDSFGIRITEVLPSKAE